MLIDNDDPEHVRQSHIGQKRANVGHPSKHKAAILRAAQRGLRHDEPVFVIDGSPGVVCDCDSPLAITVKLNIDS